MQGMNNESTTNKLPNDGDYNFRVAELDHGNGSGIEIAVNVNGEIYRHGRMFPNGSFTLQELAEAIEALMFWSWQKRARVLKP